MTDDPTTKGLSGTGQALGIAGGAISAIPIFGQIAGPILGGLGALFGAGAGIRAKKQAEREEEAKQREAMKAQIAAENAASLPKFDLGERPTGGSKLGTVFGNMGNGVGTFGANTNHGASFSVLGALQNNLQLQKPTTEPLDIQSEKPERPNMGTAPKPQRDLPQQQNATPKMGSSSQQGQGPLGSELSSILTGLGSGGGGFYG